MPVRENCTNRDASTQWVKSRAYLFQHVSVALQRGNAAAVLGTAIVDIFLTLTNLYTLEFYFFLYISVKSAVRCTHDQLAQLLFLALVYVSLCASPFTVVRNSPLQFFSAIPIDDSSAAELLKRVALPTPWQILKECHCRYVRVFVCVCVCVCVCACACVCVFQCSR